MELDADNNSSTSTQEDVVYVPEPNKLALDVNKYPIVLVEIDPYTTLVADLGFYLAEELLNRKQVEVNDINVKISLTIRKLENLNIDRVNRIRQQQRDLAALEKELTGSVQNGQELPDLPSEGTPPQVMTQEELQDHMLERKAEAEKEQEEIHLRTKKLDAKMKKNWKWLVQNCHPDRTKDRYLQDLMPTAVYMRDNQMAAELDQLVTLLKRYKMSPDRRAHLAAQKAKRQAFLENAAALDRHIAEIKRSPQHHLIDAYEKQGTEAANQLFLQLLDGTERQVAHMIFIAKATLEQNRMLQQMRDSGQAFNVTISTSTFTGGSTVVYHHVNSTAKPEDS